jgi:hypothetical protein
MYARYVLIYSSFCVASFMLLDVDQISPKERSCYIEST